MIGHLNQHVLTPEFATAGGILLVGTIGLIGHTIRTQTARETWQE